MASHDSKNEERNADLQGSVLSTRACKQCASSRARCSRHFPCKRCTQRQLTCRYPPRRKSSLPASRRHLRTGGNQLQAADLLLDSDVNGRVVHSDARLGDIPPGGAEFAPAMTGAHPMATNKTGDQTSEWAGNMDTSKMDQAPMELYDFTQPILGISGVNWMSPRAYGADQWDSTADFIAKYGLQDGIAAFPFFFGTSADLNDTANDGQIDASGSPGTDFVASAGYHGTAGGMPDLGERASVPSPIESTHTTSTSGRFYTDGAGSRAAFGGRLQDRPSLPGLDTISNGSSVPLNEASTASNLVPASVYEFMIARLKDEYQQHGVDSGACYLPSYREIQMLVLYYFEHFHPVFPFLRKSTFATDVSQDWILVLAVSSVGSRYARPSRGRQPSDALLDVLHRVLSRQLYGLRAEEDDSALFNPGMASTRAKSPRIQIIQAGILAIMCMLHCGKQAYMDRALVERHYLVEACNSFNLLSTTSTLSAVASDVQPQSDLFREWVKKEFEIRSGMMIWVCMGHSPPYMIWLTGTGSSLTLCASTSSKASA
jgi:hypothetical protein